MEWNRLLSAKRLGREDELTPTRPGRTEFESDIGRIAFAGAFRRLGRKTQVHPLAPNDHIHTRLTHTFEVALVGRALGKELGLKIKKHLPKGFTPDDLGTVVHAACLAHDLGNPPFGHAGEEAMAQWFELNGPEIFKNLTSDHKRDLISVEGNAQGFRMIAQTENHLFHGGLQLTYATLGAFQKYPWSSRKGEKKFGAFLTEENLLDKIATELGLVRVGSQPVWCRHPLAHLVEAADDICYAIMDLEDAVELKIISFEEVAEFLLKPFDADEQRRIRSGFAPGNMYRVNLARLRGPVFDKTISGAIEAYIGAYDEIMQGRYDGNLFNLLDKTDPRRRLIFEAKELGQRDIYTDTKKIEIEIGCYASFDILLSELCAAALNQAEVLNDPAGEASLKWKSKHVMRLLGDHAPSSENAPPGSPWTPYQCLRRVIDFVSGMTDNYAVYISKQLQGTGFSGVQRP